MVAELQLVYGPFIAECKVKANVYRLILEAKTARQLRDIFARVGNPLCVWFFVARLLGWLVAFGCRITWLRGRLRGRLRACVRACWCLLACFIDCLVPDLFAPCYTYRRTVLHHGHHGGSVD